MGELHLEVMVERLRSEWKVDVGVGAPRVAYQETPMRAMTGVVGRLVKQTGGQGQFAHVVLDVSPREDDQVVFNDRIVGGVVPRSFIAAVEKGVRAALSEGPRAIRWSASRSVLSMARPMPRTPRRWRSIAQAPRRSRRRWPKAARSCWSR
jgi:predicted membrane GTPase involved in stress response